MKRYVIFIILAAFICCTGFRWGGGGGGGVPLWKIGETVGVWSGAESYDKGEVVGHEGNGYISAQDNNLNHEPGESGSETWWGLVAAKGDTGATGARGATWYTGFDTPAGAGVTGADNDLFFDTSVESKVFKKVSGTWTQLGSIKGAAGADGQDGQDGAGVEAGANGEHFIDVGNTIAFTGTPSLGKCQYSTSLSPAGFYCYDGDEWVLQGGGGGTWGSITGTLSDQTDLQAALDAITAGGINITTATPSTSGSANLNDTTHVLSIASTTGVTTFTGSFTAWDTTPTAFSFTDQTDVETSATITSDAITVAGINYPASISVTGGTYDINASGSFTASSGTVEVGDTVRARHTSSASNLMTTDTVITIGGVSGTFTSTTVAAEVTYTLQQNLGSASNDYQILGSTSQPWVACSFTADANYTLNRLSPVMLIVSGTPITGDVVTAYIYSDSGGSGPGSLLATSTNTRNDTLNSSLVYYDFNFSGVSLTSGTRYWAVLHYSNDANKIGWRGQTTGSETAWVSTNGTSWTQHQTGYQATMRTYHP